jgi:hypothetical protein
MSEYNERMENARPIGPNGKPIGVEKITQRMLRHLPEDYELSLSTVRRMMLGPETKADPLQLWAYAKVCEVPLETLSERAARFFANSHFWLYLRAA